MNKALLSFTVLCSVAVSAFADPVNVDGYLYEISAEKGGATFVGLASAVEDVVMPANVKYNDKYYKVDSVSSMAFYNYADNIKSIKISLYLKEGSLSPTNLTQCHNLEKILGGGMNYTTIDDCLYTADCSTLISVPIKWAAAHTTPYPEIPNYVTTIGHNAFNSVKGITTVELPLSVTTIGANAFRMTSITSMDFSDYVTEILGFDAAQQMWQGTFNCCTELTKVSLGRGVTKLPQHMFGFCPALTTVECRSEVPPVCPDNVCYLNDGSIILKGTNTWPEDITLYVPVGCKEAYAAADGWKVFGKIEEKEFEPTPVILPDEAEIDGVYYTVLSHDDKTLRVSYFTQPNDNIVIPAVVNFCDMDYTVTELHSNALSLQGTANHPVKTITLPSTLHTANLGYIYFYTQTALESINIADNSLYSSVNGVLYSADGSTILAMPQQWAPAHNSTTYEIPNTCSTIGEMAFYKTSGLNSISIPGSVRTIMISAFKQSSIVSLDIPDTVTEMLSVTSPFQGTFMNCLNLKTLTIGKGISVMPECSLSFCPALTEVTCRNSVPPVCPENLFYYSDSYKTAENASKPEAATLYVPIGSKEAYAAAAGWKEFGSIVEKDMSALPSQAVAEGSLRYSKGTIYKADATDGTPVSVYSADGCRVACTSFTNGAARVELTAGLYIVVADSAAAKIIVK